MTERFPIYYETAGNPADPCIIMIMGLSGQLINWSPELIQGLAKNGYYVVIFDNRDCGLSKHYDELYTPNPAEAYAAAQLGTVFHPPYTLKDMADDVLLLMDELKIAKAHILGISMGGIIAQYVALNYPKRALSMTCIASTSSDPSLPPAHPEVLAFFFSPHREEENLSSYIDSKIALHQLYYHPDHFNQERSTAFLKKSYERSHKSSGFQRQVLAMVAEGPRTDRLKQLQIPALIIHGTYDKVFPVEHGQHLAQILPNSHLEIIDKMGHGLPDVLNNRIIDMCCTFYKGLALDESITNR